MHRPEDSGRAAAEPILVLASGQRCGSTLIQRLLSSHPRVMIWGEHGGRLRTILNEHKLIEQWARGMSPEAQAAYDSGAHQSWMANLLPDPRFLADAARAYLLMAFAAPAAAQGRPIWGFKEVRLGADEAQLIRLLFPRTRVVHVTRDLRTVLRSLDAWERAKGQWTREMTERAVQDWARVNESFEQLDAPWAFSVRFEDVIAEPDEFVERVAALTQLDPDAFDRSVFDRKIGGYGQTQTTERRAFETLPRDLRRLLDEPGVPAMLEAYGYRQ